MLSSGGQSNSAAKNQNALCNPLPFDKKPITAEGSDERCPSYDFEAMRKQTQNRSNYEMEVLEELSL